MSDPAADRREVRLSLSEGVVRGLGEAEDLSREVLELVIVGLVREARISLSTGARALGIPYYDFIQLLGRHEVSIFSMSEEEWEQQKRVLDELDRKRRGQPA